MLRKKEKQGKHKHEHEHAGIFGHHYHHQGSYQNIKIATFLNIGFTIIEFIGGALTNSLAIIADALHDLGDSFVLIASWRIEKISHKKPDWRRSFGYRRLSLLAAFLNAAILLGGSVIIIFQVIGRLVNPQPVEALGMVGFAVLGIVANLIGSLKLKKGKTANEKILSWHLLEDVLGWVGILIAAIIIHFTGLHIIDPIITIGFTVFVLWGVYRNSKEIINLFLEGTPSQKSLHRVVREIEALKHIDRVFDAHIWSLDGAHHLASVKAVVDKKGMEGHDALVQKIKDVFKKHHITHSTIELDRNLPEKEREQDFLRKKP